MKVTNSPSGKHLLYTGWVTKAKVMEILAKYGTGATARAELRAFDSSLSEFDAGEILQFAKTQKPPTPPAPTFSVGQLVKNIKPDNKIAVGAVGKVVTIRRNAKATIGVEWPTMRGMGHNCNGYAMNSNGRWFKATSLASYA